MEGFRQILRDCRQAVRSIRRTPFVSSVVIASVALGVGVNTTVFSWLQAIVLDPIPGVRNASAVRLIEPRSEGGGHPGTSWVEYRDLERQLTSFASVAAFRMAPLDIGVADWSDRAYAMLVSGNYFSALGLRAEHGRLLRPEDAVRPGAEPVIVVSHRFWQSRLGGSPSVVGETLRVNDRPLTVVGVAPEGFQGTVTGLTFDLWLPATAATIVFDRSTELEARGERGYTAFGVRKPGISEAAASEDVAAAMRQLAHDYPATNRTMSADLLPFWQSPRGPQRFMAGALGVLQAITLLVLLAVCGNTANLVLARATTRRAEIGVRLAMGAARWRVVSLLLSESFMLAALGTIAGVGIAIWGTRALIAVPMPSIVPIRFVTHIDLTGGAFAAALGVAAALVFGLAPAIHLSRTAPLQSIRSGGLAGQGTSRLLQIFMAIEIGLALVVLALAGIFMERFARAKATDPGFVAQGVLLSTYDMRERNRGVDQAAAAKFVERLLTRLEADPAIESAAVAASVPLDIHGLPTRAFILEGHARADGAQDQALTNTVTPGYFRTMGLPIQQGSTFVALSDTTMAPQAVVNEAFVRQFADGRPILGRHIDSAGRTYTVVGVVKDSIYEAFDEPPTPFVYVSYRDRPVPTGEIHLRTRPGAETNITQDVRRILADIDPATTLYNVRTLTDHVDQNLVFQRIPARLFVLVGPLLLVLAAIGISAVVAHGVAQRRREIGVRLALGATPGVVTRGLVAETMQVVLLGSAAGWAIAYEIDHDVLQSAGFDVIRLVVVPVLLLAVAAGAAWWPSRRAASANPVTALRSN